MDRSRIIRGASTAMLVLGFAACEGGVQKSAEPVERSVGISTQVLTERAAAAGGHVTSIDNEGVPQFIWGVHNKAAEPSDTPTSAARYHLSRFAPAHNLSPRDLESAELKFVRDMGNGGYIAKWNQKVDGIDVYPSEVSVLMKSNLDLVAISGRLRSSGAGLRDFATSPQTALRSAIARELNVEINEGDLVERIEATDSANRKVYRINDRAPITMEAAQVKRILYAKDGGLAPAYFVEFYAGLRDSPTSEAFRYILSAADGRVLEKRSLTADAEFTYRVWADPLTFRPFDGPIEDPSPHPTGAPNGHVPGLIAPGLVSVEGFNFRGQGSDPWLPDNATETVGNNVDAYSDHQAPDGYTNGDYRATLTGPRTFDRTYDPLLDPIANETQIMASVAELFYVNNYLHDYWYDSGFTEATGNAQRDNMGRGGVGGDVLRAEAQDNVIGGSRNNANMSTPSDGLSPRMQMFSWTGAETITLTVTPGGSIPAGTAAFGPREINLSGQVVAPTDTGGASTLDGCEPYTTSVTGRIVLVNRGNCTFVIKTANAQSSGAIGILIANNAAGPIPPGLGGVDPSITIGVMSTTQGDGAAIRTALAVGPVTATMLRHVDVDRDGSLDHTVVAHEWGHYLHHRLSDCGTDTCRALSEGWADHVAVHMAISEGDNYEAAFPTGVWATLDSPESSFFGIRRVAYSADAEINALTFRHVQDNEPLPTTAPISPGGNNAEVHNSGEVWCTMLTEAYVALLRQTIPPSAVSFDDMKRRWADYIVAGLLMVPRDATFTETRDGILAAALARDPHDMLTIANAFAERGAGSCAVPPPRSSTNFIGVTESYELSPRVSLANIALDESLRSCDDDGILDGDERGIVRVAISNAGPVELTNATITLISTSTGVTFPAGDSVQVAALGPFSGTEIQLEIALDATLTGTSSLELGVRIDSPGACEPTITSTVFQRVNFDDIAGATTDEVESSVTAWTLSGDTAEEIWHRAEVTTLDYAWHGADFGERTDTSLESPDFVLDGTNPFILELDHAYQFEWDPTTNWDGGVIEVSTDGGQSWSDILTYFNPGYGGVLTDTSQNPLGLRQAFVNTNASYPARDHLVLDFGTALGSQTVRLRFRIGTDAASGGYGWELDNFQVQGITNAPFFSIGTDSSICPPELVADAGADQVAEPVQIVFLDGSNSVSNDNRTFTYSWRQATGTPVTIINADRANPVFTAPSTEMEQVLTFELTVDDGVRTAIDTVDVTVHAATAAVVTAIAGADATVDPGKEVVLDGSASNTTGTLPITYSWAQTAGTPVTLTNATGAVARFTAPTPAASEVLTFELTASDGVHTSVDSVDITVRGYLLNADAGDDQTVGVDVKVVLDGSGSESSTRLPLTFTWTQMAGPTVTLTGDDGTVAQFDAPIVATETVLTFQLEVNDGERTAVDTVDITVSASTLTANAGDDITVDAGANVTLNATGSMSSGNLPLTYMWAQTAGPTVMLSSATSAVPSFKAPSGATASALSFELTVSDGATMATDTVSIMVRALPATPPPMEEEGGCGCTNTRNESSDASVLGLFAIAGLALILRKRQ